MEVKKEEDALREKGEKMKCGEKDEEEKGDKRRGRGGEGGGGKV